MQVFLVGLDLLDPAEQRACLVDAALHLRQRQVDVCRPEVVHDCAKALVVRIRRHRGVDEVEHLAADGLPSALRLRGEEVDPRVGLGEAVADTASHLDRLARVLDGVVEPSEHLDLRAPGQCSRELG